MASCAGPSFDNLSGVDVKRLSNTPKRFGFYILPSPDARQSLRRGAFPQISQRHTPARQLQVQFHGVDFHLVTSLFFQPKRLLLHNTTV